MIQYVMHYFAGGETGKKRQEDSNSKLIWQVTSMVYSLAFGMNIAITVIYWLFIANFSSLSLFSYTAHILPIAFTFGDFMLNMNVVEINQWVVNTAIIMIYLLLNWFYTLNDWKPVYSILRWASW